MNVQQNFDFNLDGVNFRLNVQGKGFTLWKESDGVERWVVDASRFTENGLVVVGDGEKVESLTRFLFTASAETEVTQ